MTKGERREKIKRNRGKMIVSNRSIFTIARIKVKNAQEARKSLLTFVMLSDRIG